MKKSPEGENPEESDPATGEREVQLRADLKQQGLTDAQIDDMMIRLRAEEFFNPDGPRREPDFFYEVYAEKLGRPLTDLEKIRMKAALEKEWSNLKEHFGLDKDGKIKES
ncbi:MAG: hypothetical protein A3J07_04025 [Candidatus Doudnabacteria bacterium RIFCSPLOWO2_02_FULL_49_13]|uniref:Uncharacterized protein n=1 Tax=Candidatus Doudnabacteria bacterium RIFCSPHIGHO2_12_FULL_48_16 TaxID=1817838 RepID=A0A1F5PJV7_9BACT|nr:MAG: hypothetical protein A3B77_02835 [Candidatus Doudnabacteria bacterium RIFCSPHIGHO2_02_FULL_49_24]OGE90084.1 MAG: hypothetical protein A3E29_03170 [Candidatus Doudnabacteria bacterium RIFCSPHIGHO2_12_FULL_48_16]OGE90452.1 MAG: hypothetical protein A2760_00810 [Candidatus Doudnabacteria bacterium RIFCSPHIGHO2_01_FULL_50_67]OGE96508.1 MAG: hypothetical protein A2990_04555 [Candidatus Doudnabacteria bacterium RIFCSPLOWO2_01_FULL_49_40]OGF03227.1 MAG: hypothetical protein A3J07_04025 [Candid